MLEVVTQRPGKPNGPQGSTGGEDDGVGGGDWLLDGEELSAGWDVVGARFDWDGKSDDDELTGGDETPGGGEEIGVLDDKGGKDMPLLRGKDVGLLDDRGKDTGLLDDRGKDTGLLDNGGRDIGSLEDRGRDIGMLEVRGNEIGMVDGGGEEEGVFDDGEGEEVVDERGGWEDDTDVGTSVDAEEGGLPEDVVDTAGKMHWPRRSTPKRHAPLVEVDGDEDG